MEAAGLLGLRRGEHVVDLACGSGAATLPAARAVGPEGRVLGIDISAGLLERARRRAAARYLPNVEFRRGDINDVELPPGALDAAMCVFGVFFAADPAAVAARMWAGLRAGGRLVLATWGANHMQPADEIFWEAVGEIHPELCGGRCPWDRLRRPAEVRDLLLAAGAAAPDIDARPHRIELADPGEFWTIVLGSGYRATTDALDREERAAVRALVETRLRERSVAYLACDVVYGIARK